MTPAAAIPAAPPAPDVFDRLGEWVADRVNPIVVKEMRQGLRTRVFWIFFALMVLACLFISLVAVAAADENSADAGRFTFFAYYVALSVVQYFVIPYSAYRSMAREREEETWVLLTLTGLPPRRVLAGKLGSFVLQGALYASACAPFMLFSYYLNGIALPTIVAAVALTVAYQVFLTAVAVSAATLAETRIVRGLVHFVLLGALLLAVIIGLTSGFAFTEARALAGGSEFWGAVGTGLFVMLSTGVLLFEAAAARLSLPTEAYARGPRLAFVVQFLGGVAFFVGAWQLSNEEDLLVGGAVTAAAYLSSVGLFVASDRDGMAKNHWVTGRRSLLKPGALRGFALVVALLLLSLGVFLGFGLSETRLELKELAVIVAAPAYALLYLSGAQLVARWIPHAPWQTPAMVRLVYVGLFVAGTAVPPLLGELFSEADDGRLNLLNPTVGLANMANATFPTEVAVPVVWAVALLVGFLAYVTLRGRDVEPRR